LPALGARPGVFKTNTFTFKNNRSGLRLALFPLTLKASRRGAKKVDGHRTKTHSQGDLMKTFVLAAVAVMMSSPAFAATKTVQCEAAALQAATFIDELGWGKVPGEPLKVISGTRAEMGAEKFQIKSTVSGFTYMISIQQDYRSEACVINEVTTRY
jgi:hypothetical protein